MKTMPTLYDAYQAQARIKPMIIETPLLASSEVLQKQQPGALVHYRRGLADMDSQ